MKDSIVLYYYFAFQVSKSAIKFIDGYYLRYREILTGQQESSPPSAFNILTVVAQKTDAYSHVIPNLKKFVQYEVFVSPFYKSVEGQPSNSRTVITAEDSKFCKTKEKEKFTCLVPYT